MLPKEVEDQSFYSPDFRETLRTLEAQMHNWARWGRALMLLGIIIGLLSLAFFANVAMAADDKPKDDPEGILAKGLRSPATSYAWIALAIALLRFGYRLIQRSWELYDKFLNLRVLADGAAYPDTVAKMTKILEKESERATDSRRPMIRRRQGPKPKPPASPDR